MTPIRRTILVLGLLGAALFAGALLLSKFRPLAVERALVELMRIETERRVGARLDELSDARATALVRDALAGSGRDLEGSERELRAQATRKTGEVVTDMLRSDCACRRRLVAYAQAATLARHDYLLSAQERLTRLVESSFASVRRGLIREFRIFAFTNGMAFALLALLAWQREAGRQLLLPALVLVSAVALTGGLYLFNQDWLHTIVFADYLGWGYAAYLAVVALLLGDIAMNRARITTAALNVVGAAASAAPC